MADALTVLAMGSVGMIVSPGGIGAYALLVMETVALYHIPKEPYGQALGWLLWFGQFLSFITFGVISFILVTPRKPQKKYKRMNHPQFIQHKIFSSKEIVFQVNRWKMLSKTISFTNGCFDILHPGHIASLIRCCPGGGFPDCRFEFRCIGKPVKRSRSPGHG